MDEISSITPYIDTSTAKSDCRESGSRSKYVITAAAGAGITAAAYYYPAETFMAFVVGSVFAVPIAVTGLLVYGLWKYRQDVRNRIEVRIKPNEAMKAIARKEAELQKAKETLYEEMRRGGGV